MVEQSFVDSVLPIADFALKTQGDADLNRSLRKIKLECEDRSSLLFRITKLCTEK